MNVIPKGFNFNFLMPGLLVYIVCMLGFGYLGGVIIKMIFPKIAGIGAFAGFLCGLYIASLLNP